MAGLEIEDGLKCAVIKSAFYLRCFLSVPRRMPAANLYVQARTSAGDTDACRNHAACRVPPNEMWALPCRLVDDTLFNGFPSFGALPSLPYGAFANSVLPCNLPGWLPPASEARCTSLLQLELWLRKISKRWGSTIPPSWSLQKRHFLRISDQWLLILIRFYNLFMLILGNELGSV